MILLAAITFVAPGIAHPGGHNAYAENVYEPHEQEFVVTAYYSPTPDQCCYVRGSETADKILNGEGDFGADGTPVYEGMIAAPGLYAFGTRIRLPGIGVGTVHDRGGAIQVLANGAHRLDVWVGEGEEGLARALWFGVRRIRGTVYPPVSAMPAEALRLSLLPAPYERLQKFFVKDIADLRAKKGESGLSVAMIQEHLKKLGYFSHAITGSFGEVTAASLRVFQESMGISIHDGFVDERTAHTLAAAAKLGDAEITPRRMGPESTAEEIRDAKRLLRFLGYYKGRTHGGYDDSLFAAVLKFQQEHSLVGTASDRGAGRIGPMTYHALKTVWKKRRVAQIAKRISLRQRVRETLAKHKYLPDRFLAFGDTGPQVCALQRVLAEKGFFPAERTNCVFGPLTKESMLRFQLESKLVDSVEDLGAGTLGPQTLRLLEEEEVRRVSALVRGGGWKVLGTL